MFAPGGPRAAGQLPQHILPRRPQRLPCPCAAAHQAGPSLTVEGQDLPYMYLWQEPVLGIFGSQRPSLETPFLCPTHLAPTTLASATLAQEQLKRKTRTFSGQDGGPVTTCSSSLVSLSKHLSFPLHVEPSIWGRGNGGSIQRGVVHKSKTRGPALGGAWGSSKAA